MKILVDENIPKLSIEALRSQGHEVIDIRGTARQGSPDDELWEFAQEEGSLLITTDKGFADRRDEAHGGILIIRLRQPNEERIHQRLMAAIRQNSEERWPGLLVVMRDTVQSSYRRRDE